MATPRLQLYVGPFGSGKSLRMIERALELCERFRLRLVTNFPLNHEALIAYANSRRFKFVSSCLSVFTSWPRVIVSDGPESISRLLSIKSSAVVLDEAGIFLNARSWKSVSKDFLASMVQIRKDRIFFLVGCHFIEQVDRQLRDVVQLFVQCRSISRPNPDGLDRMIVRWRHEFNYDNFHRWESNPQFRTNLLRTVLFSSASPWPQIVITSLPFLKLVNRRNRYKLYFGFRSTHLGLLFQVFSSGARLDKQQCPRISVYRVYNSKILV